MEATAMATNLIQAFLEERLQENLARISTYCRQNQESLTKELNKSFGELFDHGRHLQQKGKLGAVAYLNLSFLRSFILNNDYRLRLDIYDTPAIFSAQECSGYLEAGFILDYINQDIAALVQELTACLIKFNSDEIDQLKKSYIASYGGLLQLYLIENLATILAIPQLGSLAKTPDFKIYYGEYLDRTSLLYDASAPPETEEEA